MIFNSWTYILFLILVFIVYWSVLNKNIRHRNIFILFISYFFYGSWDWRFLFLIVFSSSLDFFISQGIFKTENKSRRKILLAISLSLNLGILFFFKYCNFFIDSWIELWNIFNITWSKPFLNIVLPVGISFYTFQTISYTVDVYKGKLQPSRDWICFLAYVSFFPQLVAGPIERATHLLPQFYDRKIFKWTEFESGIKLILWGLFKKVVIADYLATSVNIIFSNYSTASSYELIMGAVFFAFQIYGDFSGYSDIARGSARLLGFDLMSNFNTPYFSTSIPEFWRRWHISLSTWFRDYLYIPLGGSKRGKIITVRNTLVIFVISGLWHGANWTFIFWGFIHALFFLPFILTANNRPPSLLGNAIGSIFTFLLVCFAWIFFRAENLDMAFAYIAAIFQNDWYSQTTSFSFISILLIIIFLALDFTAKENEVPAIFEVEKKYALNILYTIIIIVILLFSLVNDQNTFIYFQF